MTTEKELMAKEMKKVKNEDDELYFKNERV